MFFVHFLYHDGLGQAFFVSRLLAAKHQREKLRNSEMRDTVFVLPQSMTYYYVVVSNGKLKDAVTVF